MAVLLSAGRHFRLLSSIKIVVGRDQTENYYLKREWADEWLADTTEVPGPTTLILGGPTDDELMTAAAVTARYSDGKREKSVRVVLERQGEERVVDVVPADDQDLDRYRI
jgi:predicted ribosome quality control (RQC) complex YloA/Tae2 family protein